MDGRKVILVTGGSGFLGQHIVRELQDEDVSEIRVFNLRPFELDYTVKHPVKSYVGNLLNVQDLAAAMNNVSCVIHTAGRIDFSMFPDMKMLQDVNVKGTDNVIKACIAANVRYLIYTSTVDVVVGHGDIVNGDEHLPYPDHHLFKGYATTKQEAEKLVLSANGQPLANGGQTLQTLSLRPNAMYGEGDPYFVTSVLRGVHSQKGTFYRVSPDSTLVQISYAGNVAWAHVCAAKSLHSGANVGGKTYFINDDTPIKNYTDTLEPFLRARSFRPSTFQIPFLLLYLVFYILEWILWLIRPIYKVNMEYSLSSILYVNKSIYFKRLLAEEKLKYKPKYTSKESLEKSLKFYAGISLE